MVELTKEQGREIIARNIAARLTPNTYVNLGVGVPSLVSSYVKPEKNINIHSENGLIGGLGDAKPGDDNFDAEVISSSGKPTAYKNGASFFDSAVSFGIIRGGHLSATVLGTMEVDQKGNIANYTIPGKLAVGMGGAMDLCVGAEEVIVATYHTNRGRPKLLKECTLPLTAKNVVSRIVTEKAVIEVGDDVFIISAYNPIFDLDEIISEIGGDVIVSDELEEMIGINN